MKLTAIYMVVAALLLGCTSTQMAPNIRARKLNDRAEKGDRSVPYSFPPGKKKLLVFFDGTSNQWDTRTNVRRLFEMIGGQEDPKRLCFYIEGVGADYQGMIGNAFGQGMQKRIAKAYAFLSEYFQAGDEIYIFGFSRGALQARALAGLISHCGVMEPQHTSERTARWRATEMVEWCRKSCEGTSVEDWEKAQSGQVPLYPTYLRCDEELKAKIPYTNRYAEIRFLGVWDTVPGSSFKDFGPTEEMEDWNHGIRYKLGAYPPIREIAHAVSINERRLQFRPVLIPPPIPLAGRQTVFHEEWFPGAHSDIGGGYTDSSELPGLTLNWMLGFLRSDDLFANGAPTVHADYAGPQHDQWSRSFFWRLWSPEDRWRPKNLILNASATNRASLPGVVIEGAGDSYETIPYRLPDRGARPKVWAGGTGTVISPAIVKVGSAEKIDEHTFRVFPWQPWNRTGFQLEAGHTYRFTAVAEPDDDGNAYADSSIPADVDGVQGLKGCLFDFSARRPRFYNVFRWRGPGSERRLRVLHDGTKERKRARFMTLIGAVGPDDSADNVFVIGSSREIEASRSGELVVFSNDWAGGCGKQGNDRFSNSPTYANNTGTISLKIEELNRIGP